MIMGKVRLALFFVVFLTISSSISAQTFLLQPASARNTDGDFVTKLLLKKDKVFRLNWSQLNSSNLDLTGENASLVIGRSSNNYQKLEVSLSGEQVDFIANDINLGPGRYYARITNSSKRTTNGIQADQEANPGSIIYSNEILLLIEANEAPAILAPRGRTSNPTPTFEWASVIGVPSYWLIVSSTPFDIVEDEDGNISIEGATVVWQYITKSTNAEYGAINRDSPFTDEAPPLNANQEYSYTVLNVYEDNNPVFTSPVFGGIVPFIFTDPNAVPKSNLENPANEEIFFSEEIIEFAWSAVPEATNYTINLLQIVKQQGIDVTVPIWTSTSTNTSIEYPAIENLKNGTYQWNVVTNNSSGGGTTSSNRFFNYKVETGEFAAKIQSSSDNSSLLGVELSARAVSGGVTPSIPYFVQNETHYDSLVAGVYEFSATKNGYETGTAEVIITTNQTRKVTMQLNPLPSSVNGSVVDENNSPVGGALVSFRNSSTDIIKTTVTDSEGDFSISLNEGTYSIEVSKSGFISPSNSTISLSLNEQKIVSESFILTNDQATVSGVIFNEEGIPVQRATVTISNDAISYETKTNGSGLFQFTVASGNWNLSVQKIGFVKPADQVVSLSTGDILQNQSFTLIGNANQVTGFVRERITNQNGSVGTAPFQGILVRAVPNVGATITTTTEKNGQYTLSLKSGSYTIQANRANYTSNEDRELVIGIAIGETISGMDFELIPNPSSISGTVLLPNGNGVADASVSIPNIGLTTTTSSGFYKLSVPQGNHTVSVIKQGLVSPSPKTVNVSTGQNLSGLNFEMAPNAGSISGKITSTGEALSNTTLTAINTTTKNEVVLINNLDGTFSLSLKPGSWYLRVEKSGFISDSTSTLTVGAGQSLVGQNFSLIKNLTTVRGTVTNGTSPIRNATIAVKRVSGGSFSQSTVSQTNGTYAFSLPAGVAYTVTSQKDGFKSETETTSVLTPESTVQQDFALSANPSSVSGTVFISGQSVLSNAKIVALLSNGTRVDSTVSKPDGSFLLGLNPNTYTLIVSKPGYTSGTKSTTLSVGQNLTGVNYTLAENFAFLSGKVTTSDDSPIEQAFINVISSSGGASTTTDQDGAFTISGLIGNSYSIGITKDGFTEKALIREVNDGDFINLTEILAPKNGSVSGTVSDENGAILGDATITASNTNGNEYTAISNASGEYSIGSLELGSYTINASKTGYTSQSGSNFEITDEELNKNGTVINDLIANNVTISGTITNSSTSSTLKDVEVSVSGERGSGSGLTNSSGVFSISNLSIGTYSIVTRREGFRAVVKEIIIESGTNSAVSDFELEPNNGRITGTITDPEGDILPFRVTVIASTDGSVLTTQANDNGEFAFEGIETGIEYLISTDIYRDGYENVEQILSVPTGAAETELSEALKVIVKNATISGSVGVSDATITLSDASTNQIVELTSSAQDGSYSFTFLGSGSYQVSVQRLGYIFTPSISNQITLQQDTEETASFTAQANIATLDVVANNESGGGISNIDVTIISADTSIVLTQKTNTAGIARFRQIEASTSYTVRPAKEGFSVAPVFKNIALSSGDSTTTVFVLSENSSSLSGTVKSITNESSVNLKEASITLVNSSSGQSFEAITNTSGVYSFGNVANGNYQVIATKAGYSVDTVLVTLTTGDNVAEDLLIKRSAVDLRGVVRLKGIGVEGVKVVALSSSSLSTTTNSLGAFRFPALPIKGGGNDTTRYQINITKGVFSKNYLITILPSQAGTRVNVPLTNLPSGKIELLLTDGVDPISGAEVNFGISGGEAESEITGSDGRFESGENLRKAFYTVSISKEGFLYPQNTIRVELPSDTTILNRAIFLPYTQLEVPQILADQETKVSVVSRVGYDNSAASGVLYYKRKSESQFSQIELKNNGDSLQAYMPVFGSIEEITFYTSIEDPDRGNTYLSSEESIIPLASGILSNIRVTPTVNGQTLRAGETYNLDLFVRDGINKSLKDQFSGDDPEGLITWEVLGGEGVTLSGQEETRIVLKAEESGAFQLKVLVDLDGSIIEKLVPITVTDIPIGEITVGIPSQKVSNATSSLFSYSAVDTSGTSVVLGESLTWQVIPSISGTIDERGVFEPSGTSMIGSFKVQLTDAISEKAGVSDVVELVAKINPTESYSLNDGLGLELLIPSGSVEIPTELSLGETTPPETKKFVFAQGTDVSYTVSDKIYIFSLSGSELQNTAQLTLPEDSSFSLNDGEKEIARFNFTTLQWELQEIAPKARIGRAAGSVSINELGQFAVLAQNEPLAIKYAAVLPSPFSPDIAPVKIGYWLDTAFPPAKVNIKIYNIRGELVKTVLSDDLQQPGRYGSSSGLREIIWDGITDNGTMARNGRYVIEIKAKDQQGEAVKLLQVILIK